MTLEEKQRLREAAAVADAVAHSYVRQRPGSWSLQTSNSFRRIGMHGDGDVLCATKHPVDGHPDLLAAHGVLDYIVAAQPRVVLELLDYVDMIEGRLDRLNEIERQLIEMRAAVEQMLREVSR